MPYDAAGNPRSGMGRMNAANEAHGGKPAMSKPAPVGDGEKETEHGHGEHDVSHMDIKAVVAKHGPATAVESTHDHEAGKHHVHSTHGEKHHHSDHGTHEAAHDHMGTAMGVNTGEDEKDKNETPGQEMNEEEETVPSGGGGVPGLS